jgi:metallophosphoesterase (TIGR00282 family)
VNIFFIGDVVGKCGRQFILNYLPDLLNQYKIDLCIANIENIAGGMGVTSDIAGQLFDLGVNVLTSGNHIWDKKEIEDYLTREKRLLRPANYPPGAPGYGSVIVGIPSGCTVGVLNLAGRVFMQSLECPFRTGMAEVESMRSKTRVIIVDFHAEATSEKIAMGWYLDGKVSAVIGTHTHVQTADEKILPQGTAYITDVGMTGAFDSVIGIKKELAIRRFLHQMPVRFEAAKHNPGLNGLYLKVDEQSGRALTMERIQVGLDKE